MLLWLPRGGSRGRVQGVRTPPPRDDLRFSNTTGILQKKTMWFIGVEVEQETSASPPKKNSRSAPVAYPIFSFFLKFNYIQLHCSLLAWKTTGIFEEIFIGLSIMGGLRWGEDVFIFWRLNTHTSSDKPEMLSGAFVRHSLCSYKNLFK